ncbi:MAG: nitrogenase cofactor biosynthesis protein NifB [Hadesarchaea archaeon]|nr:MAG: nitrogenase cofactor biosynthesis protein NifB [Hadesarchaea archaeon]
MGEKVSWDPSQLRRIREHPCFSKEALHLFGRIHLPVAPRCNIQCNYCVREFDCVNESRPGVASKVLTPRQALQRLEEVVKRHPWIKVVAIAGPGEPLFNEETFKTFRLVKRKFPRLHRCLSTNGLLLPDRMGELVEVGIGTLTVTINALDPKIGAEIYAWVLYEGKRYTGEEGARLLIRNQLKGVEEAVKNGIVVKVNTVIIPTVNDRHVVEVAKRIGRMGVYKQNLIPLIPQFKFSHLPPPSPQEKARLQKLCSRYVDQMIHCRQCRADAVGKLGKDLKCYMK